MEIIPNIPNELGRECLLRVSYKSYDKMRAVCRSWKALLNSPRFYEDRKIVGTSKQLICLIQKIPRAGKWPTRRLTLYDPLQGTWDRLPTIPQFPDGIPTDCKCVWVDQKLVIIGGWQVLQPDNFFMDPINYVFIYDFTSGVWRRGADMPRARPEFACSVSSDGLIYVAGGLALDGKWGTLRAAAAYDVKHNKWEILPPMTQGRARCKGVSLDGKFTVLCGHARGLGGFEKSAEVFDPSTGVWSRVESMWSVEGVPGLCIAAFGCLYSFPSFRNQKMMRYNSKENVWELVASLPDGVGAVNCATVWRDKVFVCGGSGNGEQVYYMFDKSGNWFPIERPHDFVGFDMCAITVEI